MSESDSDLGPMPDPAIEPGEPNPGGADALQEDPESLGEIPDLTPEENPAIDDRVPDEIKSEVEGSEDTSTEATESDDGEADEEHQPEKESPA